MQQHPLRIKHGFKFTRAVLGQSHRFTDFSIILAQHFYLIDISVAYDALHSKIYTPRLRYLTHLLRFQSHDISVRNQLDDGGWKLMTFKSIEVLGGFIIHFVETC